MNSKIIFLGLAGAMSLMLASCSGEEADEILKGDAISFNTSVSRATELTQSNLAGFRVYADADSYKNLFIDGAWAKREGTSNVFTLPTSYYWPQGVQKIRFWAYAPYNGPDAAQVLNPQFSVDEQKFGAYNPKTDLKEAGKEHNDIVVAYTEVTQAAASGSSVELKFHHALSQIEVKAILGEGARKGIKADPDNGVDKGHEGMIVYVKGAWIMNVAGSGTLSFNKQEDAKDNHILWNADANIKGNYGRVTSKKMELDGVAGTPSGLIVNGADATLPYSLMLIPQETEKYTFANENSAAKEGAYILVLCRVESVHMETNHDGKLPESVIVGEDNETHVHQMFPVSAKFDDKEFGYACVPIDINWKPGKKYTYTLQFCGTNSGAGVYPPELPTMPDAGDDVVVVKPDTDKKPGTPVLNNPLKFTVKMDSWNSGAEDQKPEMN